MGRSESLLDRRAEMGRLGEEVARLEIDARAAAAEAATATQSAPRRAPRWMPRATRNAAPEPLDGRPRKRRDARRAPWRSWPGKQPGERPRRRARKPIGNVWPPRSRQAEAADATSAGGGVGPRPAGGREPGAGQRPARVEARAASLRARRDDLAGEEARWSRSPRVRGAPCPSRRSRRVQSEPYDPAGAPDRRARRARACRRRRTGRAGRGSGCGRLRELPCGPSWTRFAAPRLWPARGSPRPRAPRPRRVSAFGPARSGSATRRWRVGGAPGPRCHPRAGMR